MTREEVEQEQVLNGFTEMMKGFFKNQDLEVPNFENPCKREPFEDAISRQAVLEYIEGSEAELGHGSENELVCHDIKELPPVTPQPKVGHWIRTRDKAGHLVWECDKCRWQQRIYTNFCPDCGVKMQEVEE